MAYKQTFKRRRLLAAGAGTTAGLLVIGGQRAAAQSGTGDQGPLVLGSNNFYIAGVAGPNRANISSAPTVVEASPNFGNFIGNAPSHVFKADATPASGRINGMEGHGNDGGAGVVGAGGSGSAVISPGVGVLGVIGGVAVPSPTGNTAILGLGGGFAGVSGIGSPGVGGQSDSGVGVSGFGVVGVSGSSSDGLGGEFDGGLAPLRLVPAPGTGSPSAGAHRAGEFYVDSVGALFYCSTGGSPGTWIRLSVAPTPSFVALPTPERFVDTRINLGGVQGPVAAGSTQTFQITGRDGQSANASLRIPDAANAIAGNLTVVGGANAPVGSFVTLWPGGPRPTVSNINFGPGAVVANSYVVSLTAVAGHGNVSVFNQQQGDYILDVTGYYAVH